MAKTIYPRDERKAQFTATGIKLAKKTGLAGLTISAVAKEHKVTPPLIFHIFGNRAKFHAAVKAAAKKQGVNLDTAKGTLTRPRKRSVKEVKAIKNKVAAKPPKKPRIGTTASESFPKLPTPTTAEA
jgi:AcrR family transcriptional regulator